MFFCSNYIMAKVLQVGEITKQRRGFFELINQKPTPFVLSLSRMLHLFVVAPLVALLCSAHSRVIGETAIDRHHYFLGIHRSCLDRRLQVRMFLTCYSVFFHCLIISKVYYSSFAFEEVEFIILFHLETLNALPLSYH